MTHETCGMLQDMRKSIVVAALAIVGVVGVTAGCATAPVSNGSGPWTSAATGSNSALAGARPILATVPAGTAGQPSAKQNAGRKNGTRPGPTGSAASPGSGTNSPGSGTTSPGPGGGGG